MHSVRQLRMQLPLLPGGGNIRQRRVGFAIADETPGEQIVVKSIKPTTSKHGAEYLSGLFLAAGMIVTLVTVILCLVIPPGTQTDFGSNVSVSDDAHCFRLTRESLYPTVELSLGSPMHVLRLLVLLDEVAPVDEPSIRIFSSRVAESTSLKCNAGSSCTDVAIIQHGTSLSNEKVRLRFTYLSLFKEELQPESKAINLGLDGDIRLSSHKSHLLLRSSLCIQDGPSEPILELKSQNMDGTPTLKIHEIVTHKILGDDSPLSKCIPEDENAAVSIFPSNSVIETWWLALTSNRMLQTASSAKRRNVVEAGQVCGERYYTEEYSVFSLDCASGGEFGQFSRPCDSGPSLPFRRVAHRIIRIDVDFNNTLSYAFSSDATLKSPDLDVDVEFVLSVVKLILLLLTASVVFTRARRETSDNELIFCDAYAYVKDFKPIITDGRKLKNGREVYEIDWEDFSLGLSTILARGAIIGLKVHDGLIADGHERIVVVQLVAVAVSFLHFCIRQMRHEGTRSALAHLGGSTAIIDAVSAVMLSFADVPLQSSSYETFGGSARLLTAMLLSTVALQRCVFAIASCGLRFGSQRTTLEEKAPLFCILLWLAQAVSIAVLLADVFGHPNGYHLARARCGPSIGYGGAATGAVLAASGTALSRTTLSIIKRILHESETFVPQGKTGEEKNHFTRGGRAGVESTLKY